MTIYRIEKCPHCGKQIQHRNEGQNDLFHALCGELAGSVDWPRGSKQFPSAEQWKRLLIAAFERSEGRKIDIYPALDGHGFDVVYRRSSRMSKQEMNDLITFAQAWCAEELVVREQTP